MFQVQPEQIAALNPERFVMFANDLIWAEANKHAIPPEALTLNSRIYEGGVDAKVDDASGRSDERWLPQGLSVWEFKSGPIKPGMVKAEVLKRRQELGMGARIIIATGASFGTTLLAKRRRALTEALRGLGLPPERGRFLSGSDLARWATEHLSAVLFFGIPIGSCLRVTDWERSEFHQGQFVADEQREEIKLRVAAFVSASGSPVHFRVEGRRGIGKTRLVLEAVRGDGIRLRTLYAQDPGMLPREFWNWARSEPRLSGVLVVDECDNDEARLQGAGRFM